MKSAWNTWGREDPYHWVMTGKRGWEKEEYYATGREHFDRYVRPYATGGTALDIGCGTGRITRYFPELFTHVIGVDISRGMIVKAREDNPGIDFLETNGQDLAAIPSGTVDFCFSYATLQHVPTKRGVFRYFDEIHRVLKPGGKAVINVRGSPGKPPGRILWFHGFNTFYTCIALYRDLIPFPWLRRYDPLAGACFQGHEFHSLPGFDRTVREDGRKLWVYFSKSISSSLSQ